MLIVCFFRVLRVLKTLSFVKLKYYSLSHFDTLLDYSFGIKPSSSDKFSVIKRRSWYDQLNELEIMTQHRSSGLATILNELAEDGCTVLDLGPMSSGTTAAFLNKRCKCYVEDLVDLLNEAPAGTEITRYQLTEHLLAKPEGLKFDVILCWDVLNFFRGQLIEHLMDLLEPFMKRGTIMHMMRYVGPRKPVMPQNFQLQQDFTFDITSSTSLQSSKNPWEPNDGLSMIQLLKHLKKFNLRNTIMNQSGMQQDMTELLLEYDVGTQSKLEHRVNKSDTVTYFAEANQKQVTLPVLNKVLTKMSGCSIFDTGRKMGRNVSGLNQISSHLYVEDVFSSISWHSKLAGNSEMSVSDYVLKFNEGTYFDVVLTWDLFNYCHPENIRRLGHLLKDNLRKGSLLHFILLNHIELPSYPLSFNVSADLNISCTGHVTGNNRKKFGSTAQLLKLLPDFKLLDHRMGSFDSGEGYHELLLKFQP